MAWCFVGCVEVNGLLRGCDFMYSKTCLLNCSMEPIPKSVFRENRNEKIKRKKK
jgi:hypothetical protein